MKANAAEIRWISNMIDSLNTESDKVSPWINNVQVFDIDGESLGYIVIDQNTSEYLFASEADEDA